ncbi:succinate-semialdehyde dehydrogenase (NADP(+)), partial [Ralstonia pseudosolanacearum]
MALTFDQLRHTGLIRTDNLIDGRWSAGADGARYAVTDPATGSIIAQVADSSAMCAQPMLSSNALRMAPMRPGNT